MASDEITRLRDRMHNVESKLSGLEWFINDYKEFRRETRHQLSEHERQLDELVKSDEIAEAVAEKMKENGTVRLTKAQTWIAALAMLAAFASPFLAILIHTHGHG